LSEKNINGTKLSRALSLLAPRGWTPPAGFPGKIRRRDEMRGSERGVDFASYFPVKK
jgi:hypothetical protein